MAEGRRLPAERACEVLQCDRYGYARRVVRELAGRLPLQAVHDVGAGKAVLCPAVEEAGLAWRGWDMAPAAAGVHAWNLEEPCPQPGATAGLVLMLDVIEHLANPGLALRHVAAIVAPGGWLLVTTPNPRWSRSRLEALRTGYAACFTEDDLRNGHLLPVWPHALRVLLGAAGLQVERHATLDGATRWPAFAIEARYPLRLAVAALCRRIERSDPSACGMSYAMLARKPAPGPC